MLRSLGILLSALWLAACSDDSAPAAAADVSQARDGAQLYRQYCVTCHGSGALGAPKVGKEHRLYWSHEIEEEGFDTIVNEAIAGINSMPPWRLLRLQRRGSPQRCHLHAAAQRREVGEAFKRFFI